MIASPRAASSVADRLAGYVRQFVDRSPRGGPMLMAAFVGLLTGLGAVGFRLLIDGVDWFFFDIVYGEWLAALPDWRILLIPALGALLVGPITSRFAPETRGPGVSEVLMAVETAGGRIRPRVAFWKSVTSALTIGSGGSAGTEGPIVQIGSGLGSYVATRLRLSEENVKLLLASGAAGGIAATFNAPIAGVFFALEVILRRFNTRNFSVVVLASVVATTTAVAIRGDEPTIPVAPYELVSAIEIPLYAVMGALAGLLSVGFIHGLYWTEDRFRGLPFPPQMFTPVLGGLLVGTLALVDRGVLGVSQEALDGALSGETGIGAMMLLLLLKFAATSITIGSGGSGGVFRPSLFLGGMLGGAYGGVVHELLPGSTGTAGAYALVGMGAVVAGTARSPITAVLILFELTRDYAIILPVMIAVVVATVVSQLFSPYTIYTFKLARRGVLIEEEQLPVNVMQTLRVSDAMSPTPVVVSPDTPISEVAMRMSGEQESVALLVDEPGELIGIITDTDLNEALTDGLEEHPASEIATTSVRTVYPDQSLHEALQILAGRSIHVLPVTLRESPGVPCGVLRRSDITNAYARAIDERDASRRRGRLTPVTSDDVRYLELRVAGESALNGHRLSEVRITEDAVIVAIRRDGMTLIPRGHTRLEEGDRVTVIAAAEAVEDVRAIFQGTSVPMARQEPSVSPATGGGHGPGG